MMRQLPYGILVFTLLTNVVPVVGLAGAPEDPCAESASGSTAAELKKEVSPILDEMEEDTKEFQAHLKRLAKSPELPTVREIKDMPPAPQPGKGLCKAFDRKRLSEMDPTKFDLRTLAQYRQDGLLEEDPFGDYALMHEFGLMVRDKVDITLGKKKTRKWIRYSNNDFENARRAQLCLKQEVRVPDYDDRVLPYDRDGLVKAFVRAGIPLEEAKAAARQSDKITIFGGRPPIDADAFVDMMVQVMREEKMIADEPLEPIRGEVPRWSKKFLREHGGMMLGTPRVVSKLLVALANGRSSKVLRTGHEDPLEKWLLAQPPRSVQPHEIFRQAYRLNKGDVTLTLLTIENVLSQWFMLPDREHLKQTNRLSMILNHIGENTDLYGPWYHLWGAMLYAYAKGGPKPKLMMEVESLNAKFNTERGDVQENLVNQVGARIGVKLRRAVVQKRYDTWKTDRDKYLDPRRYNPRDEDFSEKIREFWKRNRARILKADAADTSVR